MVRQSSRAGPVKCCFAAVFKSDSKSNLKLLIELAKKLGIKAKLLSETEVEDIGLANAIKIGRTGEFADTDIYLEKLRK
ncbi:hypothetical protein ES705_17113 [subsurface metagenome]